MTAKCILFDHVARRHTAAGLDALANAVKVTLGPRGRNVVLEASWGAPTITKDGATVAKEIELEDRFANMGAQMVKEVASKTSEDAGDGTTTATVLAQAIYTEGVKLVVAGADPMELGRGVAAAVRAVVVHLRNQSTGIQQTNAIAQVGTISANGDQIIGDLIAEAMEKVGRDGVITVEEAQSTDTSLETVHGMQFDRGYLSPYFVTDTERMEVVLEDAHILIHDNRISNLRELLPLLEEVAGTEKSLFIIAEDIEGEALATLVVNRIRGGLKVCAVKAPEFGDRRKALLEDIAVVSGGQVVTEDLGIQLANVTLETLGHARIVTIDKDRTTIVDGGGTPSHIRGRVSQLRSQLEESASDSDREKLRERIAKLAGGVAVLKVGAATETEMKERKARVDDALNATRAAVEEGVVPGGGVALLRAIRALRKLELPGEQQYGVNIVRRALEEPLRQLAQNAGVEGAIVVDRVRQGKGAFGYNVATESYEDLIVAGIIDPTKVVRVALQNAASVASMMLTTAAMVAVRMPGSRS